MFVSRHIQSTLTGLSPLCKSKDFNLIVPPSWHPKKISKKNKGNKTGKKDRSYSGPAPAHDAEEGSNDDNLMYCHKTDTWVTNTRGTKAMPTCRLLASPEAPSKAVITPRKSKSTQKNKAVKKRVRKRATSTKNKKTNKRKKK